MSSLKFPDVSRVFARYVKSPKASIGLDLRDTPAATVKKGLAALKFSSVAVRIPPIRLITTSFKSKSTKSPVA